MGVSLLKWYIFSAGSSFCISKIGDYYIKEAGCIPDDYCSIPMNIVTILISLIPVVNVISAFNNLVLAMLIFKNEEIRDKYKKVYEDLNSNMHMFRNIVNNKIKHLDKEDKNDAEENREEE